MNEVNIKQNIFLEVPESVSGENWFASEELVGTAQSVLSEETAFNPDEEKAALILEVLFSDGLKLSTAKDFKRISIITKEMEQMAAYARQYGEIEGSAARRRAMHLAALDIGLSR